MLPQSLGDVLFVPAQRGDEGVSWVAGGRMAWTSFRRISSQRPVFEEEAKPRFPRVGGERIRTSGTNAPPMEGIRVNPTKSLRRSDTHGEVGSLSDVADRATVADGTNFESEAGRSRAPRSGFTPSGGSIPPSRWPGQVRWSALAA